MTNASWQLALFCGAALITAAAVLGDNLVWAAAVDSISTETEPTTANTVIVSHRQMPIHSVHVSWEAVLSSAGR